jgi:osmotically inducible protein OsmC
MPTRTARTAWNGSLETGEGQVELTSSKIGTYDVSFPKRAADEANGSTSPEELLAAAHSACYAKGATIDALHVQADVSLGADPSDGGFKLTGIHLIVRGEVTGIDNAGFVAAAEAAKAGCPLSKALTGVTITLDAALED